MSAPAQAPLSLSASLSSKVRSPNLGTIRTDRLGLGHVGQIVEWVASEGRLGVARVTAIVNATSNFVLTRLADCDSTFATALEEAQRAGEVGADPSRDLDGLDAADKLTRLASLFGWSAISRDHLEVEGIRRLTTEDLAAAREIGGAIKPIVWAARRASGVEAFVGPAFLSRSEPLAAVDGAHNGIRLDGKHVSNLFLSGPGGGPDVTSFLDNNMDAAPMAVAAPLTPWFLRVTFPGHLPQDDAVRRVVTAAGFDVAQVVAGSNGSSRWLTTDSLSRQDVGAACARLHAVHRIESYALRRLCT
ncbi:MAG: hypothetical protein ACRD2N_09895 [Vicinamibacterales bacterium]